MTQLVCFPPLTNHSLNFKSLIFKNPISPLASCILVFSQSHDVLISVEPPLQWLILHPSPPSCAHFILVSSVNSICFHPVTASLIKTPALSKPIEWPSPTKITFEEISQPCWFTSFKLCPSISACSSLPCKQISQHAGTEPLSLFRFQLHHSR